MNIFLKILLSLFLLIAVERFCHKQTRGFSLQNIASTSHTSVEEENDPEIAALLDQPFTFLSSGGQCYAFISSDKRLIIKFFKHHHIRLWNWIRTLSLPQFCEKYRTRLLESKIHQSPQFFESCQIAYRDFKDRSGLLYLHLTKTRHFQKKLKIIDPLGIAHLVDLDTTDFALQQRAELAHPTFRKLMKENDLSAAKSCIDSLLDLIRERCQRGISDRDPNIRRNFGFLGTHAIEIDLGSFTRDEELQQPEAYKKELLLRTQKFHAWLERENKELALYLSEKVRL